MNTLLIDNYDSFTYNLYQLLGEVCGDAPVVVRNDAAWSELDIATFDAVVVSPGPGRPERPLDFGISAHAISESGIPLLGVCLGHQGICHLHGASIQHAPEPMHGRLSLVHHRGADLFAGLPTPFSVVRYHSLAATEIPDELEVVAWTPDGIVMGVRHRQRADLGRPVPSRVDQHRCTAGSCSRTSATSRSRLGRPSHPRPAGAPSRRRRAAPRAPTADEPYDVHVRRFDFEPDADVAHSELFTADAPRFWLDSSAVIDGLSRFSFMGDGAGPLAEYVSYDVSDGAATVQRRGERLRVDGDFFDYLDAQLRARRTSIPTGLPFEFNLGYVGCLGYELKAQTGGHAAHCAETPDAALLFADRMLAIDHLEGTCYLLALSVAGDDADALAWLDHAGRMLTGLPRKGDVVRSAAAVGELVGMTDPRALESIDARHDHDAYLDRIEDCLHADPRRRVLRDLPDQRGQRARRDRSAADVRVPSPDQPRAVRRACWSSRTSPC